MKNKTNELTSKRQHGDQFRAKEKSIQKARPQVQEFRDIEAQATLAEAARISRNENTSNYAAEIY